MGVGPTTQHRENHQVKNPSNMPRKKPDCLNGKRLCKRKRILNAGTWNVQGLRTKQNEVLLEVKRLSMDIVVLTETKKKGRGSEDLNGYIHFYSGVRKEMRAKAGVSILINKHLARGVRNWEQVDERLIKVEMLVRGYDVTIIGAYAPNEDSTIEEKDDFYSNLSQVLDNTRRRSEVLLMGDFNAWTGSEVGSNIIGRYGEDRVNVNGELLLETCNVYDLKILNGFYEHKSIHKYTWTQNTRGLRSIIDYIICKQRSVLRFEDVRAFRGAECGSDHYLLKARIILPCFVNKATVDPDIGGTVRIGAKRYNVQGLAEESTRFLYKVRLAQKLSEVSFSSAHVMYEEIATKILEAANEALGEVPYKSSPKQPWWNDEIQLLVDEKKQSYQRWLSSRCAIDWETYALKNKVVKREVAKAKNQTWQRKCDQIDMFIGSTRSKEAWGVIKSMRTDSKELTSLQMISTQEWIDYYEQLLTENRPEFAGGVNMANPMEDDLSIREEEEITLDEVKRAVHEMKSGKAAGPGGFQIELIKYAPEILFEMLTYLFNQYLRGEDTPAEWRTAYISNLYKKGDRKKCTNYRGLSVINSLCRVYGKILKYKIEQEAVDAEEQNGFRAGRSCTDGVFCIRQVITKRLAHNQDTHLVFIDLAKAYDSIPLCKLWQTMESQGISTTYIRAVRQLYDNMTSAIKIRGRVTKEFRVTKGLRQGCCIAPTLFKIYINGVLEAWKRNCAAFGIPIGDDKLFTLLFADDQVLLAEDRDDMDYMLRKLNDSFATWGLSINAAKTEYLVVGGNPGEELLLGNNVIPNTSKYKYLGVTISNSANSNDEIHSRMGQARAATRQLNSLLWDNAITKSTKIRLFKVVVESIATYGAELWEINKAYKSKILATEMDFWRRCCRYTRMDRVRNIDIRNEMGIDIDLIETIEVKRLRWYGHLERMTMDRWPKRVWEWTPPQRRKRGRPRRSWRDDVEEAMAQRDLNVGDWLDRRGWKKGCEKRRQP